MTHNLSPDERNNRKNNEIDTTNTRSKKLKLKRKQQSTGIIQCDGPYNSVRGETALWVAVITQAMMDALSRSKNAEAQYHKHEALRWLTGNSNDFKLVCMLAERDPDAIRCKAKRALMSPVAWRAAPGKGKRYQERKAYRQRLKKGLKAMQEQPSDPADMSGKVIIGPWQ